MAVVVQEKNFLTESCKKKLLHQLSDIFPDNEVIYFPTYSSVDKSICFAIIEIIDVKNQYYKPVTRTSTSFPIYSYFWDGEEITKSQYDKISDYKREYSFAYANWYPEGEEKNETNFYQYLKANRPNSYAIVYYEQYRSGLLEENIVGKILKKDKNSSISSVVKIIVITELERTFAKRKRFTISYKIQDKVSWVEIQGDEEQLKKLSPGVMQSKYYNFPFKEEQFCKNEETLLASAQDELVTEILKKTNNYIYKKKK